MDLKTELLDLKFGNWILTRHNYGQWGDFVENRANFMGSCAYSMVNWAKSVANWEKFVNDYIVFVDNWAK